MVIFSWEAAARFRTRRPLCASVSWSRRAAGLSAATVFSSARFLGGTAHVPWIKRALLKTVAAVSPAARRLQLTDAHNGLRVLNRAAASQLKITMNGMAHASEIVDYLARSELHVTEVPVTVLYTDYSKAKGQSLINGVNILFDLSLRSRRTP